MSLSLQITSLLSENVPPAIVATTLGCDPSYVSQIASERAEEIRAARLAKHRATIERDNKLDDVEDKLITRLNETVPYLHKPGEIARVFQIVNSAKRRNAPADLSASSQQGAAVVTIILPTAAQNPLIINQANNQVVQIGQTPLVPLQVSALERAVNLNVQDASIGANNPSKAANLLGRLEKDIG